MTVSFISARKVFLMTTFAAWPAGTMCAGENWPQFRSPHANGQSAADGLPVTFGKAENILWKTPVAGKAWSSPVVWDQQI